MTKELLHPGLGSGALRERLCERITSYLTLGGLFNAELANHDAVRELLIDCRVGLSLSSPIEAERGLQVPTAGGTCTHCGEAIYANSGHYCKAPTPQASSEIRERIEALPTYYTVDFIKKADVLALLAPSRQGAAKRVEG